MVRALRKRFCVVKFVRRHRNRRVRRRRRGGRCLLCHACPVVNAALACLVLSLFEADHVRDVVPRVDGFAFLEHRQRDLQVWLGLGVWVVFDRLVHPFGHHVLLHAHSPRPHPHRRFLEPVVNRLHHHFPRLPRQDVVQHELPQRFREAAPVAPHEVQTFGFFDESHHFLPRHLVHRLLHHQGCVLLLFQQQHGLIHPVQLELQGLVQLVDFFFHLVAQLFHVRQVRGVGVDHDRVRVAVNHLHVELRLREVHGALQRLPPHRRHQGGDGFRAEAALPKPQAPV
mmetsp:Transcript_64466/g.129627  ORF Transcript_64466/g.129627 Transcript_64466/m.129627 type:complete len:284 (+) Transcript_64466:1182-2033(+)